MQTATNHVHVLHVDDDPHFAALAKTCVEEADERFVVETATSAAAGLEYLQTADVDCVVSDYDMPRRNGIEFLETVRSSNPDLPFVLFTGKGSEEVASDAISAGVTDYLQKETGTDQFAVLANRIANAVERYRAEAMVERAFQAMDDSREGIALLDDDGYFVYVNESYADLVGYEPGHLAGEPWDVVYPDEQARRIHEEVLETVVEAGRWTGDAVCERSDGGRVLVNQSIASSGDGTMICLIRDHTDVDAGRRALREERRRFDLLIDAVTDYAIFMLDPDGYVTSWNPGAERLKGYTEDEILGVHFSNFYTDEQRAAGLPGRLIDRALEEGSVEHRGPRVRKDGSTFPAKVVITAVFDEDGTHRGFGKVTEDTSDRDD